MVLVQKWAFFQLFFYAIYFTKMIFTIFQSKETPFQAIKTRSSKSQNIDIFPKGLTHGFGAKMAIFATFFFRQYRPGKFLLRYCSTKNAFLGYKKKKFKKSKNSHFSKRVNPWFSPENGHFSNFLFQAIQARKMSFTIFQSVKTFSQAIKTRSSKSRKIDSFPTGLSHGFGPKMAIFLTFIFQEIQARKMSFTILQKKKRLSTQ